MKDGTLTPDAFRRDIEAGDWLTVAEDIIVCDTDGSLRTMLNLAQRQEAAEALAKAIVDGDEFVVDIGESDCWAEVGRLLNLRFSDAERANVMYIRQVRHGKQGRDLGVINRATASKVKVLMDEAEGLRKWWSRPLTRAGMAIMGRAGMIEAEVRHWRLPCEYLP
jgi:hypothetical protein